MVHIRPKSKTLKVHLVFGALGTVLLATACNFRYEKDGGDGVRLTQENTVGYAEINAALFRPKCLGCHARKAPILTSYESVAAKANEIWETVLVKHTMPKRRALSDELQAMLRNWIRAGMPREGSAPPARLEPSGIPRPYTFASFKTAVLDPKCNICHDPATGDGLAPFDTYKEVMRYQGRLKSLMLGVEGDIVLPPEDQMPPPDAAPLSDEDKALMLLWYADGNRDENGIPMSVPPRKGNP
jgi:hypothetical protein